MSERPAAVRIDDLGSPVLTQPARQAVQAMGSVAGQVVLSPDAVLGAAAEQTGLDDFGDDGFREPLGVLCAALEGEAGLSAAGRVSAYGMLVQLASNRLLVEQQFRSHPEVLDCETTAPIVIAGLPRTGTTHLHNLLAADPGLRYLPYWESLEPVLPGVDHPDPETVDPRWARTADGLAAMDDMLPLFKRMHEMTTWHAHEEIQLLAIDFSSMLFDTIAEMPSWREWYVAADQTAHYRYLKKVLQLLQWQRGGRRWVLKSPQHLEQFGPLSTVFPDATVVITHRDPVAVIMSLSTMISYTARMRVDAPDPRRITAYWADRIEELLTACVRDREMLPADRSLDIRFDDFMADDMSMVQRVYDLARQPLDQRAQAAIADYLVQHPRGRHGGILYDVDQLGLDVAGRRRAMAPYMDHFGLRREDIGGS